MKKGIYLCICFILVSTISIAGQFNNEKAVKGLSSIRIVCDVNVGDPDLLLTRMYYLDTTYSQLLDIGGETHYCARFPWKSQFIHH